MELLKGDTLLGAFRAAGKLPWRRAFEIAKGVCNALGEAHALEGVLVQCRDFVFNAPDGSAAGKARGKEKTNAVALEDDISI